MFWKKDRLPRIAYREQRNGVRKYFVEVWASYETGNYYSQDSAEFDSLEDAQKTLKNITDREIVKCGEVFVK